MTYIVLDLPFGNFLYDRNINKLVEITKDEADVIRNQGNNFESNIEVLA